MDDDYHYHFCYLSMILDAYSEEIVGWSVGPTLDTDYPPATHEHRYDDSYGSIRVNLNLESTLRYRMRFAGRLVP